MQTVLGYGKFAAGGGDWGAFITNQLGHKYADRLIGIYLTMTLPLDFSPGNFPKGDDYAPHEKAWLERGRHFSAGESGYAAVAKTKPQTLSYGITIRPRGCAPGSSRSAAPGATAAARWKSVSARTTC